MPILRFGLTPYLPPRLPLWQVLRGVTTAKEVLYWTLIVGFPCAGWLVLFPSLIYLKFSRCGWKHSSAVQCPHSLAATAV